MRIYNPNLLSRRTSGNGEPCYYEVFRPRDIESMNGRGFGEGFGVIYDGRAYGLGAGIGPGIGVGYNRNSIVRAYTSSKQPRLVITTTNESNQ